MHVHMYKTHKCEYTKVHKYKLDAETKVTKQFRNPTARAKQGHYSGPKGF